MPIIIISEVKATNTISMEGIYKTKLLGFSHSYIDIMDLVVIKL